MILKWYKMSDLGQSTPYFIKKDTKNQLSLAGTYSPYGIRTRVTAVKRRCLNPLDQRTIIYVSTLR